MHALQKGQLDFSPLTWNITFQVQFTLVNRRHHCRKCGVVCCNACSSKRCKAELERKNLCLLRFLLPAQSSKPLRVCMTCYDELSSQSVDHSFNKGKLFHRKKGVNQWTCWSNTGRVCRMKMIETQTLCLSPHCPLTSPESSKAPFN